LDNIVHRAKLEHFAVVLHSPHFPENIGSAARACKNMGISRLIVVDPLNCDLTKILTMATHAAEDIVANMEVYDDLEEALGNFQYVVGTTARQGSNRPTIKDVRNLAQELVSVSQNNHIALLFGPENRGLANRELKYCHALLTIPTTEFASLNVAQAVVIVLYEIFTASLDRPPEFVPRLANVFELENMYRHLATTLAKIHFINPENPEYWMMNIRRFFARMQLRARDIKIIRGICRQIEWYCEQQKKE
jgi:tRNA/rRNA methyltransferase